MDKKEEKKGFWASLFAPKPCLCCCGDEIEEVKENTHQQQDIDKEHENESKNTSTCDGSGNC